MTVLHWLGHNWHDLAEAVSSTVQAAGIIAAGTFGYLRFVRGRVIHSSLALEIKPTLIEIEGDRAMQVECTVRNAGSVRQLLDYDCEGKLEVMWADAEMWRKAKTSSDFYWPDSHAIGKNILADDDNALRQSRLEPGESVAKTVTAPVPPGAWVAYKIRLTVDAKGEHVFTIDDGKSWSTEEVVVPS